MKKTLIVLIGLVIQSCWYYEPGATGSCCKEDNYLEYKPVRETREELDSKNELTENQTIIETGKIYVKDNYIFINEKNKGFHVIENSNPEQPKNIKFISVVGSTDLAIRDNIFYINQGTDLITAKIDLKESKLVQTKRVKNVFPPLRSPYGDIDYNTDNTKIVTNLIIKAVK
jgi:hypothetical protein